jgi:hypothetical protein
MKTTKHPHPIGMLHLVRVLYELGLISYETRIDIILSLTFTGRFA